MIVNMKIHKKTLGLILLIAPIPTLTLTIMAYSIMSFVFSTLAYSEEGQSGSLVAIEQISRIVLGILGLVSVVGIFVAMPIGFILLLKSSSQKTIGHPGHHH